MRKDCIEQQLAVLRDASTNLGDVLKYVHVKYNYCILDEWLTETAAEFDIRYGQQPTITASEPDSPDDWQSAGKI